MSNILLMFMLTTFYSTYFLWYLLFINSISHVKSQAIVFILVFINMFLKQRIKIRKIQNIQYFFIYLARKLFSFHRFRTKSLCKCYVEPLLVNHCRYLCNFELLLLLFWNFCCKCAGSILMMEYVTWISDTVIVV